MRVGGPNEDGTQKEKSKEAEKPSNQGVAAQGREKIFHMLTCTEIMSLSINKE